MPILLPGKVNRLTERAFKELDYKVMGLTYEVHNDLGRHCDEMIYENELVYRLKAAGIATYSQFPITLRFGSYQTTYKADLLVEDSTIYEIKAAASLSSAHRAQALSYVLLIEAQHGKLVNFGGGKVEGEYVSTQLNYERRHDFSFAADRWMCVSESSRRLKQSVCDLIADWGLFLETPMYRNAIVELFGGASRISRKIALRLGDRCLGMQEFDLIDPDTILAMSSLTEDYPYAERHYQRLLKLTGLPYLQWINFARHRVEFVTLTCSG